MSRVLLTGMSGVGKSSVIRELRTRGYPAVDMDEPGWSVHNAEGDQVWCEDRLRAVLASHGTDHLFVSGCAENQVKFYPEFSHIILMSAPVNVIRERLVRRTENPYGKIQKNWRKCWNISSGSNRCCGKAQRTRS